MLLALDADQPLTLASAIGMAAASAGFSLTLVLVETLRVAHGPRVSEAQRNLVRPALILLLLMAGLSGEQAVPVGVVAALGVALWQGRDALLRQNSHGDVELVTYVAERGRDLRTVFVLGAVGLVFGAMGAALLGLLEDASETGIFGTGSRYGMLVNVALLAGNAQMVQYLVKVAARTDASGDNLSQIRRQVRLVRVGSSALLAALAALLPLYAWIVDLPVAQLWQYAAVVALSYWLQGLLGPANIFLMQEYEVGRLIHYHLWGLMAFGLVGGALLLQGTTLTVPVATAAGANTVNLLSWLRIGRSRGIWV